MAATPLRVVVAGAGASIFAAHRRGLAGIEAMVVGVQDADWDRACRVAGELGCPAHRDIAGLVSERADLAVITAPHVAHSELAITSLRAGLHVLVEKPIAVQVAEADAMVAEAERRGLVLAVALQQRTRLEVREARRLVGEGFLGELQRADLLATWPRRHSYFETAPWRGSWRREGGGVLVNQGQHDLDLLCHLAGAPARVAGWTRTRLHPVETEDTAEAMVEWAGGALGSIHISTGELDEHQRIELTGTAGRLRLVPGRLDVVQGAIDFRAYAASPGNPYQAPPEGRAWSVPGGASGHEELYRDLAAALAGGRSPIAPGSEATVALELANAIVYSSKTGATSSLPLDRRAYGALLGSLRDRSDP
ncbi:MAG: Gfo/Idh/MocA family oxidoreductase [Candidatus Dormibacteraeota bacterium]|nr:Gfo/Idh/MocA family oxidoreductase [Candidatus Dormibacteraeota bacterium]